MKLTPFFAHDVICCLPKPLSDFDVRYAISHGPNVCEEGNNLSALQQSFSPMKTNIAQVKSLSVNQGKPDHPALIPTNRSPQREKCEIAEPRPVGHPPASMSGHSSPEFWLGSNRGKFNLPSTVIAKLRELSGLPGRA